MQQYHDLLKHILENGVEQTNRTGINTISTFGYQTRFNLQEGFPIVTTKKTNWGAIVWELAWFLRGETNIKFLKDHNVRIWNEWADENGELGPGIYGKMWRDFGGVDQISQVIEQIKTNPDSRRLIVTAWNPPLIPETKLPPCHLLFQFSVTEGKLSCLIFQRSADSFLGIPFNFASYALLTHLIAKETGLEVGELIHVSGDLHIYTSHLKQVEIILSREPYPLPKLELTCGIDNLTPEGAKLINYQYHPFIKAEVAV